jgi:hypothetical protein
MQLEDIMLGEVNQVQKDKGHIFSLMCRRWIQQTNTYTKTNITIHKVICRMFAAVELLYRTQGRKKRKRE